MIFKFVLIKYLKYDKNVIIGIKLKRICKLTNFILFIQNKIKNQ